jgi:hypothetical protein
LDGGPPLGAAESWLQSSTSLICVLVVRVGRGGPRPDADLLRVVDVMGLLKANYLPARVSHYIALFQRPEWLYDIQAKRNLIFHQPFHSHYGMQLIGGPRCCHGFYVQKMLTTFTQFGAILVRIYDITILHVHACCNIILRISSANVRRAWSRHHISQLYAVPRWQLLLWLRPSASRSGVRLRTPISSSFIVY